MLGSAIQLLATSNHDILNANSFIVEYYILAI